MVEHGIHLQGGLTKVRVLGYALGHMMNDMCAACWFNYLLFYLIEVRGLSEVGAGAVLLSGQFADGMATPLAGIVSDRLYKQTGKRLPVYLFGTVAVTASFFLVWHDCYLCLLLDDSEAATVAWYGIFGALFNVGWASVQISHLSLLPCLTILKSAQNKLIGLRTAFTYTANVLVLLVALILFDCLGPTAVSFRVLSYVVLAGGLVVSAVFRCAINESFVISRVQQNDESYESHEYDSELLDSPSPLRQTSTIAEQTVKQLNWLDWMKERQLYVVSAIYMLSRLSNNVIVTLLPFYLINSNSEIGGDVLSWQLALYPMCLYLSSIAASIFLKQLGEHFARNLLFRVGGVCCGVCLTTLLFIDYYSQSWLVLTFIIVGASLSLLLNSSFGYIATFIGRAVASGGFVWGAASFFDKLATGLVLFLVTWKGDFTHLNYVTNALVGIPVLAICISLVLSFLVKQEKHSQYRPGEIGLSET